MEYPESFLHYSNTVIPLLKDILHELMSIESLNGFRLAGGTNLALKYQHRISVDIDMFTDSEYGSIDFHELHDVLCGHFKYVSDYPECESAFGVTFFIGESVDDCVKVDLMYTEPFICEEEHYGSIRLAAEKDMVAMKMNAVFTGARKKDFWDIHLLMGTYTIEDMVKIHYEMFPYSHNREELLQKLVDFRIVEDDPDPICLMDKDWETIKADIAIEVSKLL